MISNTVKASSTGHGSLTRQFHKALILPAAAAICLGVGALVWQVAVTAPALSFGVPGQVHFAEKAVASGSEQLLCFDAVEWKRLCPGLTFTRLTPVSVTDPSARAIDLDPHTISTPTNAGLLPPKCRTAKVPAGMAPGLWRMSGHASNTCALPLLGSVTVTSFLPETTVIVKP